MHSALPLSHLTASSSRVTPLPPKSACSPPVFPFFRNAGSPAPAFLRTLHPLLPPLHANFFELLDSELEKVDSFYSEREKEMRDRGRLLKEHLNELGQRRKKYYASLLFSVRAFFCFLRRSNSPGHIICVYDSS
ncbi:uncharacterized protein HD556DRAFT_1447652 [Suillus plorans]|uniref:SPX domain-containing protein n=1 Tax=Suillus plorans TaxID=116603 RepID=A0A9P7DDN2_9AGAM|nr:uncharacterized protein HD556DRAFT_1447652 [Suillus plorans]KAG1788620.1 hypothetical protein HD556DRAFT_1447652 [Suillus plorans]